MANVKSAIIDQQLVQGGPYGITSSTVFPPAGQQAVTASIGDVIYLGRIPAGNDVNGLTILNEAVASLTGKVGYAPVKSSDGPSMVDDYWFTAGTDFSAATRKRSDAFPIRFEYDVYIIMTIAGAGISNKKVLAIAELNTVGTK